ncbi:MAG: metallophosphoesterase family protein [Candidatus Micrarchaeota archaeon]|nr:metallophosphoesterase family protein [Candidatus Micrarchaeota archaeon]
MKIAFVTDTHFGYRRFEQDALSQGREAILSAARQADILVLGRDNFDSPIPKMETLAEVTGILREALAIFRSRGISGMPIFAIHGNHDRRARGFVHPTELLARGGFLENVHNRTSVFEVKGEKVAISGMGNVPDDLAREGLGKVTCKTVKGAYNVFALHQSFQEFDASKNESYLSVEDLPDCYDLYLCGHVHKPSLTGKVLNPGSTVVTQLKQEEAGERGWLLYDTGEKKPSFMPIDSRRLCYSALIFESATPDEIKKRVEEEAKRLSGSLGASGAAKLPLVKIVVKGTLAPGFGSADLRLPSLGENVFVDNAINSESLLGRIAQIKLSREKKAGARQQGMEILRKRLEGTAYSLGDPEELFEALLEGNAFASIVEKVEKAGKKEEAE